MSNTAIPSNGAATAAAETKTSTAFLPCTSRPPLGMSKLLKLEAKLSAKIPEAWTNIHIEGPDGSWCVESRDAVILWLVDERAQVVKKRGWGDVARDVRIDGKYDATIMDAASRPPLP